MYRQNIYIVKTLCSIYSKNQFTSQLLKLINDVGVVWLVYSYMIWIHHLININAPSLLLLGIIDSGKMTYLSQFESKYFQNILICIIYFENSNFYSPKIWKMIQIKPKIEYIYFRDYWTNRHLYFTGFR